jgi:hypothetical protein
MLGSAAQEATMDASELADRMQLRDLVNRYPSIPDDRNYALVEEIFTQDAQLIGPGFSLSGREQIRAGMQAIEQYSATLHCVHNQRVDLDGDRAAGEVYCVANHLHEVEGVPYKLDWGVRYGDRYRREAGVWRIARRELNVVWEQDLPLQQAKA